jgi:hypothetical protein
MTTLRPRLEAIRCRWSIAWIVVLACATCVAQGAGEDVDVALHYVLRAGDVYEGSESIAQVQTFTFVAHGRQTSREETIDYTATFRETVLAVTDGAVSTSRRKYVRGRYEDPRSTVDLSGLEVQIAWSGGRAQVSSVGGGDVPGSVRDLIREQCQVQSLATGAEPAPRHVGDSWALPLSRLATLFGVAPSDLEPQSTATAHLVEVDRSGKFPVSTTEVALDLSIRDFPSQAIRQLVVLEPPVAYRATVSVRRTHSLESLDDAISERVHYLCHGRAVQAPAIAVTIEVDVRRHATATLIP